MEVADQGRGDARIDHPLLDCRHGRSRLRQIYRNAHELGTRPRQLDALLCGALDVWCIGVRHRLNGNRRAAANLNRTDLYTDSLMKPDGKHLQNS